MQVLVSQARFLPGRRQLVDLPRSQGQSRAVRARCSDPCRSRRKRAETVPGAFCLITTSLDTKISMLQVEQNPV